MRPASILVAQRTAEVMTWGKATTPTTKTVAARRGKTVRKIETAAKGPISTEGRGSHGGL